MKKTSLIYLICSIILAIVVMIAVMLPMAFFNAWGVEGDSDDEDGAIYGKLVLASASATGVYNGNPLTDVEWHLVEGTIQEGHALYVNVSGSQTNVGTSDNHISATIFDQKMKDVSSKYEIEYRVGKLEVVPRELCVIADSDMKIYDATPLVSTGYTLESNASLLQNHTLDVVVTGTITEVGQVDNIVESVTVLDENKEDVTKNYNVTTVNGILVVYNEDTLVFKSGSDAKRYDSIALTNSVWERVSGNVAKNHTVQAEITGVQKEVGSSKNTFTVKIFNEEGTDVTQEYEIICVPGTLVVIRGEVEVRSNDAEKPYDGSPLTEEGYGVTPENLQTIGLVFEVTITGEQTAIGSSPNTIESILIRDEAGEDVTKFFTILLEEGTLTVTNGSSELPGTLNGSLMDSGNDLSDDTVIFELLGSENDTLYLKMNSFGNLNSQKNGWDEASDYGVYLPNTTQSAYYLVPYAMQNGSVPISAVEIAPTAGYFALPYYSFNGEFNVQRSDVSISGSAESSYTVYYYDWDSVSGVTVPKKYSQYEEIYYQYVMNNYRTVDVETSEFMDKIIIEQGFDANDPAIIGKVARYIQSAAEYNSDYDRNMDYESNVVKAFLSTYKEGVCRHYAAAATLLYRTLGIPARYTVGFVGDTVDGEITRITGAQAHAWVEVYVKGIGWMNVEVTGSSGNNAPKKLTLSPRVIQIHISSKI